jgi:hypothetical protein
MNAQVESRIYESTDVTDTPKTAADLVKLSDQYRQAAVLHYAMAEKIFDHTEVECSAHELAGRLGLVANKVKILLNALVALGLLKRSGEKYLNTDMTNNYLRSASGNYLGPIIDHQRLQWQNWPRMGEVLRSEQSLQFQQENRFEHDHQARDAFNNAMVRLSQPMVDAVKALPIFDQARSVIDLAGGHGTYLAQIAKAHRAINGQIWDLPATRQAALRTIEKYDLSGRISFFEKNILEAGNYTGANADVVLLNDCLHYFDQQEAESVIGLAAGLVNAGGALLILTMTLNEDRLRPALSADFSLHMMINTNHGELHPTAWIGGVAADHGLNVSTQEVGRYTLLICKR